MTERNALTTKPKPLPPANFRPVVRALAAIREAMPRDVEVTCILAGDEFKVCLYARATEKPPFLMAFDGIDGVTLDAPAEDLIRRYVEIAEEYFSAT